MTDPKIVKRGYYTLDEREALPAIERYLRSPDSEIDQEMYDEAEEALGSLRQDLAEAQSYAFGELSEEAMAAVEKHHGAEESRQELIGILRERSFKRAPEGEFFTLASGKKSSYFVDVKQTALSPDGIFVIGRLILEALWDWKRSSGYDLAGVAGVALGGCPLATAVTFYGRLCGIQYPTLYVRKEAKDHGTGKLVEGKLPEGSKVALLEDVATTGGSSLAAVKNLQAVGIQVPLVIVVVDREEGAAEAFKAAGVDFVSLVKVSEL